MDVIQFLMAGVFIYYFIKFQENYAANVKFKQEQNKKENE